MLQDIYIHLGTLLHMHILPHTCTCMFMAHYGDTGLGGGFFHTAASFSLCHGWAMIILAAALEGTMSPTNRGSLEQPGMATLAGEEGDEEGLWSVNTPLYQLWGEHSCTITKLCLKEQVWSRYLTVRLKYIGKGTHSVCSNYNGSDYQSFIWTLYMNIGTFWVSPEGYLGSSYM